jgi:hypothetical protein
MFERYFLTAAMAGFSLFGLTLHAQAASENACSDHIKVSFAEGAPVDKFKITNQSKTVQIKAINIDLSSSKGRLIFDTISGGKGVEVFQPYQSVSGNAELSTVALVEDGSDAINLDFKKFSGGDSFTFSIDVDDQLTASELGQIRVTGGEMAQAKAVFLIENQDGSTVKKTASFNNQNEALLKLAGCQS